MKHDPIQAEAVESRGTAPPVALLNAYEEGDNLGLAHDIMNIMEQGILVWSAEGICELHNTRVFKVMELTGSDLYIGIDRQTFRERAMARGEMSVENDRYSYAQIRAHQPYSFDRHLPSGRVVLTNGRPMRGGGYVVTFTDVTEARQSARDLAAAKQVAEPAEASAREIERARQSDARLLARLDEWLQSCKLLEELFKIVAGFMAKLLPESKGELYIYSNSRDVLDGMCRLNTRDLHQSIAPDSCWALRRGRPYACDATYLCFVCDQMEAHQHGVQVDEYICVPIVAHGDTVGLLHICFVPGTQVRYVDGILPRETISAGMAIYPQCGSLLRRADEALYRAKDGARNSVMAAVIE